jgi:hypothetical protein
MYSLVHDKVSQHVVPCSHVYNRAGTCANSSNSCIASEYIVTAAEKGVDSQVTMLLEKNTELIDMSPFMKSDETVVYVRLQRSVVQEALRNGKVLGVA